LDTLIRINGEKALFNTSMQRWEVVFTNSTRGSIEYTITEFEDQYGLTMVVLEGRVPRVNWSIPPISPMFLYISGGLMIALAGTAGFVIFARKARKRVTTLEHALTPEELLSLEEVGISSSMREQIVSQLEWLRDLSEDVPYTGTTVLSVLYEELTKAKQMYLRAFELEPPKTPAGLRLKEMLLDRIDLVLTQIEQEMEHR
jgi:hypothetical protein